MIEKKREFPKEITILKVILKRFTLNHQRQIELENKLSRKLAGYKGEKELDYYLSQIDHTNLKILHDLRIPHNNTHFQIDSLLISNTFLLPIDSKNYAGVLDFNPEFNYLLQTLNGFEKVYQDPILQTKIQASQLKSFLMKNQFSPPPIEFLVSVSNSQAIIRNPANSTEVANRVCKTPAVSYKIQSISEKYNKEYLSQKEVKKIVKLLLKSHVPYIPDIQSMNLPMDKIQIGVQCPDCGLLGMEKIHGSWVCKQCGHLSKDAHIAALKDYFLIFGPHITSRQFSNFLNIPSIHQAKRLLTSMELDISGSKKGTVYRPKKDFPLWD
ncbi:NERD domain-containing protein [Bacillus sp. ISL-35]|uniref:nuclease-related domain-containing protein n=1 Tax=Bacillus sp. ISL-35 TaxID=2819122 RepID=UPI001BE78571|nr:nuclease-related domain-containing protein [Bacillus sp. ISL-35]MBT2679727.1 NERD domain-containing protein [Bacillus sp. ISL-35]MBT2704761.1 NERD domain-containing protein [Chryseobacterium sp. ISL-80]